MSLPRLHTIICVQSYVCNHDLISSWITANLLDWIKVDEIPHRPLDYDRVTSVDCTHSEPRFPNPRYNVVPVDLDLDTLSPSLVEIERAITRKTVAIVVAHVYGARVEMGPIIRIARSRTAHDFCRPSSSFSPISSS